MLWWNIVENTILSDLSFSLSLVSIFMNKWKTIHLFVQCLNASSFQYRLITNYTYIVLAAKYNWMNTILKHHKLNTKAKWFQFFNCATLLLLFLASYSEALNNINSIKSPSQCCSTSEPIISGSFFQLFKWVNQAERISMVALLQTEITFYCFQFVVYQWFFFRRCCRYCCCCFFCYFKITWNCARSIPHHQISVFASVQKNIPKISHFFTFSTACIIDFMCFVIVSHSWSIENEPFSSNSFLFFICSPFFHWTDSLQIWFIWWNFNVEWVSYATLQLDSFSSSFRDIWTTGKFLSICMFFMRHFIYLLFFFVLLCFGNLISMIFKHFTVIW